jgi:LAO/AO transport system kinase
VLVPESGDSIQAMKAGLMEIADFFVLNKSDRAGADQAVLAIQMILHFREPGAWTASVVKATASMGEGIEQIASQIAAHRAHLEKTGELLRRRRGRLAGRIGELVSETLRVDFWSAERKAMLEMSMEAVIQMASTPYDVAEKLIEHFRSR